MCACNQGMGLGMGLSGLGLGYYDISGNWIDESQMPTETTIPVVFTSDPTAPSQSSPNSVNWNQLLGAWTNISGSILKASAGANPSYQQLTPNGSVTVYGSGAGVPTNISVPGTSIFGQGIGLGTMIVVGAIGLVLFSLASKH